MCGPVKGKRWLLLRWVNLDTKKQRLLNDLFWLNWRMMKA
jgi:hypothetical protein